MRKRDLDGQRILVIEDDYFLAQEICEAIAAVGGQCSGPYGTIPDELPRHSIDAAVLDIHIRGRLIFEFADRLAGRDVPFVFATAISTGELPQTFRSRPLLSKPVDRTALIKILRDLCVLPGDETSRRTPAGSAPRPAASSRP